jgi:hypothetical protein
MDLLASIGSVQVLVSHTGVIHEAACACVVVSGICQGTPDHIDQCCLSLFITLSRGMHALFDCTVEYCFTVGEEEQYS